MKTANIMASLAIALWFLLSLLGLSGLSGVAAQHVPGYPNMGQIKLYVAWPMCVKITVLLCAWFCNMFRGWPWLLIMMSSASLLAILPYMAVWGGGV